MTSEDDQLDTRDLSDSTLSEIIKKVRAKTPARLLAGRSGPAYRTKTQLELREAHAAARDAVRTEFDLIASLGADFVRNWSVFEVSSQATTKDEYLLRPDLGRHLSEASRETMSRQRTIGNDLQIVIGDGLSVTAVAAQVPPLLPLLTEGAKLREWTVGQIFVIRHCRVGILNQIGELLKPQVAVLLIGERPGLATAESLSAYMAYQPTVANTDANRNLISNIHKRGVSVEQAAERILNLAAAMMKTKTSGYQLREELLSVVRSEITR
ncbi:MAG TPA: ethanolamine ammonia-lyase subunit EutC [Terriglobales bacterium]|jgi:ethanolamine ammonia-lyase small subunit|nr:ethanolamine ammonia-lyase subunit EutC [Terriglobales bacterium]